MKVKLAAIVLLLAMLLTGCFGKNAVDTIMGDFDIINSYEQQQGCLVIELKNVEPSDLLFTAIGRLAENQQEPIHVVIYNANNDLTTDIEYNYISKIGNAKAYLDTKTRCRSITFRYDEEHELATVVKNIGYFLELPINPYKKEQAEQEAEWQVRKEDYTIMENDFYNKYGGHYMDSEMETFYIYLDIEKERFDQLEDTECELFAYACNMSLAEFLSLETTDSESYLVVKDLEEETLLIIDCYGEIITENPFLASLKLDGYYSSESE